MLFLNLSGLLLFHQRGDRGKFGLDGVANTDLSGLGLRGRKMCPRLSIVELVQCDIHERPLAGNKFPHRQRATPGEGGVIAGSNCANIRATTQGQKRNGAAQVHVRERQTAGCSGINPGCQIFVGIGDNALCGVSEVSGNQGKAQGAGDDEPTVTANCMAAQLQHSKTLFSIGRGAPL